LVEVADCAPTWSVLDGVVVEAMPGFAELLPFWLQVDETVWTLCRAMVLLFMLELLPVVALPEPVSLDAEAGVTCPVTATVWFT
jgi:hypothetical protein